MSVPAREGPGDIDEVGNDLEEQSPRDERRRFVVWVKVLLLAVVPVLLVGFGLKQLVGSHGLGSLQSVSSQFAKKSESSNDVSWRLDTNKNYTMDVKYWLKQTKPRERHYYMNVTTFVEESPDGIRRNLTVVNGQYPGPLLEANAGDTLFIHVDNQMEHEPVTIHCHGLFYNRNNSFQDGAAYINQCPIPPKANYTYRIELDEKQYGTYWYHSHFGSQYADGLFGPLVIHSREEYKAMNSSYDKDIVVLVNDYYHDMASNYLPDYLGPANENTEPDPDNGLIQGQNRFDYVASTYLVPNGQNSSDVSYTPVNVSVIDLDPSSTYRLRLINAGFFLTFDFEIDSHDLEIVEADGTLVDPITVDSLAVSLAERYSFILKPRDNRKDLKNYWMQARFNQFCAKVENKNFNPDVRAIVSYSKHEDLSNLQVPDSRWQYGGGDVVCNEFDQSLLHTANATSVPRVANGSTLPDVKFEVDVSFLIKANQLTRGYLNDQTFQNYKNGSTMYQLAFAANNNTIKNLDVKDLVTSNDHQYMLNINERGTIVDIVINNYDDGSHPFHLHGHKFWVLAIGKTGFFNQNYYTDDSSVMNFENPVRRDTVNIPGFGWGVLRFVADSPGVWPFHCHIGWHMESGLMMQFNILQEEYSNWDNYPRQWYEQCQYWQNQL